MGKRMTYFTLYTSVIDVVDELSDDAAGRLLKDLLHYTNGDEVFATGEERLVFKMVCKDIDRANERYQSICEKRSKAGQVSAARRYGYQEQPDTVQQMRTSVSKCQQVFESVLKGKGKVKEKVQGKVKVKGQVQPKASRFAPPTLEQVQAYCSERNAGVDPQRWYDYYSSNGWMVGRNRMKDWRAAVRTWERNGYSSPAPAKQQQPQRRVIEERSYEQRSYEPTVGMPDWMKEMQLQIEAEEAKKAEEAEAEANAE